MVFPKNDYITFSLSKTLKADFTFPDKKPKDYGLIPEGRCNISN